MKRQAFAYIFLILAAASVLSQSGVAPEKLAPRLDERLSILKPFIGKTWGGVHSQRFPNGRNHLEVGRPTEWLRRAA
jgi:hypothetical protein